MHQHLRPHGAPAYDQVQSVAAGNDLSMPGPRGIKCIIDAVHDGRLSMAQLDDSVTRILSVVFHSFAVNENDNCGKYDRDASLKAMDAVLRESMILLANDGVLPLSENDHICFFGKRSKKPTICPAGSSNVVTSLVTNVFDETFSRLGSENVSWETSDEKTNVWVVTVGADGREGADRPDLDIDEDDKAALDKAISQAQSAGGKVVVIVNATGPVDLTEYLPQVNAVLCPFLPGTEGGKITAEALFGDFNPSGKLAITWPRHYYDVPSYKNFGGDNGEVWYGEGIYVGYRWYDARHIEPQFPFGYGKSYTNFEISRVDVPAEINVEENAVPVTVTICNTGAREGSEVIQVYVGEENASFDRPVKELKAFRKIRLIPGEEKSVVLSLTKEDFASYSEKKGKWITEPGLYRIYVGTSSRDIARVAPLKLRCMNPFGLSEDSSIGTIVADTEALTKINQIIGTDIRVLCQVALDYAPDKTLRELWHAPNMQTYFLSHGDTKDTIASKYTQILTTLHTIEVTRI